MRIVIDSKKVARNAKIGQYTSLGAVVILGLGLYLTFTKPDQFILSIACLLVGFLLSQLGIFYGNRWGRRPRPDEIIDKSLKGLGREYTMYHYTTPVHHLLVGPPGAWVIKPYYQNGVVTYTKKRWRIRGGGFAQSYLRIFGQEGLGRPDLEAEADAESVQRYFNRYLPKGTELPEVQTALLFAHPKVELHAEEAPLPTLPPKNLKEFLRKKGKDKPLPESLLDAIRKNLPQPEREK